MKQAAFHPGQLVVCIDDETGTINGEPTTLDGLTKGTVYTVRWCGMFVTPRAERALGIRVAEIYREWKEDWPEIPDDLPYLSRRFRPVDDSRLDIFRRALASVPKIVAVE